MDSFAEKGDEKSRAIVPLSKENQIFLGFKIFPQVLAILIKFGLFIKKLNMRHKGLPVIKLA